MLYQSTVLSAEHITTLILITNLEVDIFTTPHYSDKAAKVTQRG